MMGKIMKRNDFGKIVNYTMKGNNKSKLLATEGVRSDSKQHIAESFSCQAGLNTRIRTPVYHISLSFSKQDSGKLTDDLMVKIAGEYMEKMNIKNTQYIVVRHYDREHPHIHLVINRVDNDGKTISDSNDRIRNNRVCRELTIKYGLYMPKGKENVKYDRLRGKDKHKYEMMFAIRKALEKSNNWSEFQKKLSRDKIHFTIRTDSKGKSCGIVFSRGEYTFSGSRIDRSLSYFKIANMLIKYENNLDISDSLGNTQQDKIQEQEKDTVTPAEHEEIYENDITSPTGNSIINAVADLLLQPNAVISNPTNSEENFADKWPTHPKRKENFFRWLRQVKSDVNSIISATGIELRENVGRSFGDAFSKKLFNLLTEQHKVSAINGGIKIASTGALGSIGKTLNAKNTFYGKK